MTTLDALPIAEATAEVAEVEDSVFAMALDHEASERKRARFGYERDGGITIKAYFPEAIANGLRAQDDALELPSAAAEVSLTNSGSAKLQWENGEVLIVAWVPEGTDVPDTFKLAF